MWHSTFATFMVVDNSWHLIPYLCHCHWCGLALPDLMILWMQPHVMCVYEIFDPHLPSWPPSCWANWICGTAVITVRMIGEVLDFSFTCMRLSTDVMKMESDGSVSHSCCCHHHHHSPFSLSWLYLLHLIPPSLLAFFAFSHLLVVAFAIHVDTELFLGVGLWHGGPWIVLILVLFVITLCSCGRTDVHYRKHSTGCLPWNEWKRKKWVDWDKGKMNWVLSVWELCESV